MRWRRMQEKQQECSQLTRMKKNGTRDIARVASRKPKHRADTTQDTTHSHGHRTNIEHAHAHSARDCADRRRDAKFEVADGGRVAMAHQFVVACVCVCVVCRWQVCACLRCDWLVCTFVCGLFVVCVLRVVQRFKNVRIL